MGTAILVVAVLLGLVLLLLAVPVGVAFRVAGVEPFTGQVAIRWLFGLVRLRLELPRRVKPKRSRPKAEPRGRKARAKPKARGRPMNVLAVLGQGSFRRRLFRFVRDLVRAAHVEDLRLHMRLGLGDPADTGRLWGLMGPLHALAQHVPNAQVEIEPEFVDPVLELDARGHLLLIPLQVIVLAAAFALSPASIRAWRTLRGGRG